MNGGVIQQTEDRNNATSSAYIPIEENWKNDSHLNKSTESIPDMKSGSWLSSPYGNVCPSSLSLSVCVFGCNMPEINMINYRNVNLFISARIDFCLLLFMNEFGCHLQEWQPLLKLLTEWLISHAMFGGGSWFFLSGQKVIFSLN